MKQTTVKSYVGLDIAKDFIDIHVLPQNIKTRVPNNKKGMKDLLKFLPCNIESIVMEATGKYSRLPLSSLQDKALPVTQCNPRQIRRFAQATNFLAKTDKIDAYICALFAQKMTPKPSLKVEKKRQALADLEKQRLQFTQDLVRYKNRAHGADKATQRTYQKFIKMTQKEIEKIKSKISQLIAENEEFQALRDVVSSAKGVGEIVSAALVAKLPELGKVSRNQIVALVGVAPFNCDSGYYRGKRRTFGGRKELRDLLHMAALVATRHNPVIRRFYQSLLARGKKKKVALTACVRKLIIILNAMVRDMQPWNKEMEVVQA